MNKHILFISATVLWLSAASAPAAPARSTPAATIPNSSKPAQTESSDAIIVTGASRDAVRERAEAFLRGTGVAGGQTPAARWDDPICPKVVGLAADHAKRVVERVRAVALDAGIAVGQSRCDTNIVISFVADGAAVVRNISKRFPAQLSEASPARREALKQGDAPIRWWYRTEHVGKDGHKTIAGMPVALLGDFGNVPTHGTTRTLSQYNSSIISTQTRRVLRSATIVVDATKTGGRPLDAVASYAAMISLAEIKGDALPSDGTILGLFESEARLRDLSEQDRNFLAGLYRLRLDRSARYHRGWLVAAMTDPPLPPAQRSNRP